MAINESLADTIIKRRGQLETIRSPWNNQWQLLGEFIHTRKQEFQGQHSPGEFLSTEIWDSKGPKSAKTAASSLVAKLWPSSVKRFRLSPPRQLPDTKLIKEYYEFVTQEMADVFDNPAAGFQTTFDEYMLDSVVFGTAGIDIQKDPDTKVVFRPWGVKHMSIGEGKNGRVDTVYVTLMKPLQQVVKQYGLKNVSQKTRDAWNKKDIDKKIEVIIAIEPRMDKVFGAKGNRGMPWQSVHLEVGQKNVLKESGFDEMPIKVGRFTKFTEEVYGRSPGMDAIADIMESNAIWEAVTIATEKTLDPPLMVLDDGKLGGGEIDTSAGAINVFNITGRAGERPPVAPMFTVGEISNSVQLLEALSQSIADHFFLDKLLDFNSDTVMTAFETNIRNTLRNDTLGSVFSRQISEVISPTVDRTFNVMLDGGHLGVKEGSVEQQIAEEFEGKTPHIIPPEVVELMERGENVYNIEYFTPAMRIMQAEEAEGILRTWQVVAELDGVSPTMKDNLNEDESIRRLAFVNGAPSEILFAPDDVEDGRQKKLEAQQKQQEMEQQQAAAEAMRNAGQSGLVPTIQPSEAA